MQRVAEVAGVSKSAVSLALRDDPRLALDTRRRVQEVASRLGYRKNPIVASLMAQLRVSHTPKFKANIALINCSPERTVFDLPGFADFRRGIRERAGKAGYGVEEFWTEEPGRKLARLHQILVARSIKGLIVTATVDGRPLFEGAPEFFREFCLVAVGIGRTQPALHRASNNHFQTARRAVEAAHVLGYRRPGLVSWDRLDRSLDRAYSAGVQAGVFDLQSSGMEPVAPLLFDPPDPRAFANWWHEFRPDIIVTEHSPVRDWLRELELNLPGDVGLLHLDWAPHLADWAGMNQNNRVVGAAAADLIVTQTTNNELGPPEQPKLVLIESDFVWGPSVNGDGALLHRPARPAGLVAARAIVARH